MKRRVLVVFSLLVLVGIVALASEEVMIKFPRTIVGMSRRGNCLVVVHYQTDERNRVLNLSWDSLDADESGSSEINITYENNGIPLAKDLDLSAGEYVFVATLYRSDGSTKETRQTIFVTR